MKRLAAILLLFPLSLAAQEHKIAVVSMAHAHVWLHLGTMLKSDKVKLVGIAETDPNLIARAKRTDVIPQTNGVSRPRVPENLFFSDYRKMIDETKPDIVWAFTETNRHLEVVEYCAPRKIHVMMEKPLAATYQQAMEIQRLARKHGIQVFTNYSSAWQASNYAVKAAVDAGVIGPVYRLRAVVGHGGPGDPNKSSFAAWLADPLRNGGGALMDFGCYSVLWSLWLKGRPESVYASANHLKPETYPQVEDNATIILNYKDGVGIFEASWDLPPRPPSGSEVFGRTGSIVMGRDKVELRKEGAQPTGRAMLEPEDLKVDPLPPERAEPIAYMVDRLKAKQPVEGLPSLHLNVDVVEVLEAAKISIKTGRAIKLPLEITQSRRFSSTSKPMQQQNAPPADPVAAFRAQMAANPIQPQKLGDNLTLLSGPGGNVVVLNGADGKFVVDTFVSLAWRKLKESLDAIGNGPLKTVINTHWHFDHVDNNAPLHAAGATVLAHENTKKRMTETHDLLVLGLHFPPSPADALP